MTGAARDGATEVLPQRQFRVLENARAHPGDGGHESARLQRLLVLWLRLVGVTRRGGFPHRAYHDPALHWRDDAGGYRGCRTARLQLGGRGEQRVGVPVHLENHHHWHASLPAEIGSRVATPYR